MGIPAFARYLFQIHARIHPIFSDDLLASLDNLPRAHPMNDVDLAVTIELVIEPQRGGLVRRGVVHESGITAFDIGALSAVEAAAPFGSPPSEILSSDGNVYIHWTFHRDAMACSTRHSHPFRLAL